MCRCATKCRTQTCIQSRAPVLQPAVCGTKTERLPISRRVDYTLAQVLRVARNTLRINPSLESVQTSVERRPSCLDTLTCMITDVITHGGTCYRIGSQFPHMCVIHFPYHMTAHKSQSRAKKAKHRWRHRISNVLKRGKGVALIVALKRLQSCCEVLCWEQ